MTKRLQVTLTDENEKKLTALARLYLFEDDQILTQSALLNKVISECHELRIEKGVKTD